MNDPVKGFAQLVDLRAQERPDAIAVDSVESGPHTWSELHDVSVRLARGLREAGVGVGEPVLTMLPADFGNVAVWAACARLRAIEVPVNHAYRGAWLRGIIDRIGARVTIVDARFWENWVPVLDGSPIETVILADESVVGEVPGVRTIALSQLLATDYVGDLPDAERDDDLSIILHTSGTTGLSKGVMLPWSALWFRVNQQHAANVDRGHDTVYYAPFGPFHWTGRGRWYEMAVSGTRVVTRHAFKTDAWLSDVRRHACTHTALIGAMPRFIESIPERPDDVDNPLQLVNMGPVLPNVDEFRARFGVQVMAAFSMTEIPYTMVTRPPHVVSNETHRSCGVAAPDVPIMIADANGRPVGPGEVGELLVGGDRAHVNLGYYNMPAESEQAWLGGWFHTGDLFRYDDAGRYYFVDRAKDALRRRGENISSMEIESVVNRHPSVAESAVIGVPSEWGEDEVKVVVVLESGESLDPAELIAFMRPELAEFAVPRYVEVVAELPKTQTMKVQKVILRESGVNEATWDRMASEAPSSPRRPR